MNKVILVVIVLLLGVGAWFAMRPTSSVVTPPELDGAIKNESKAVATNTVELKDFAFNPKTLTLKVGSTVTFTNKDIAGHSVTADDNSFDSGVLGQGESTTVTFDKTGTFGYHCTPHPNMTVSIVVE